MSESPPPKKDAEGAEISALLALDVVGPVDPESAVSAADLAALVNHGVLYSDCAPEELPAAVKIADAASELANREGWTRERNESVTPGILRADRAPGIVRKNADMEARRQ